MRRRWLAAAATLLTVIGVVLFITPSPALACFIDNDNDCYRSVSGRVTSANLNVRAAPWGTVIDNVPNGYTNTVDCYVQASDGSYWDWLYDTRIGRSGWVYDPYLYTGGNIYQQVDEMHEGNCASIALTIPGNVQATATSTGTIRVTWTDTNSGGAKYVVSNGNVSSADLPAGSTSYTWGGLAPNTYMCFTVAAKASGGQSPWSPYSCTTTWPLKSPTYVAAYPIGTGSLRVIWNDLNGGASQYVVSNGSALSPTLGVGTTSYTWTGLEPNTGMCFNVAAQQSGQQSPWTSSVCATTLVYLNMGDSFSSGEGTFGPWDGITNTSSGSQQNMCHRSSNSYSGQFAAASSVWHRVTNVACAGAVTGEITAPPNTVCPGGYYPCNSMFTQAYGEQAQINQITTNTGLITITIGGNNLNLAGLVRTCYEQLDIFTRDQCFLNTFDSNFITNQVDKLAPTLEDTYAAIQQRVQDVGAYPKIVVLTYPQTFPNNWSGVCYGLWSPVTSPEQSNAIRNVVSHINTQIKIAATNRGLTVLDEENAFLGHEECTPHPWVNDLGVFGSDNDALHPTTEGYSVLANDLKNLLG